MGVGRVVSTLLDLYWMDVKDKDKQRKWIVEGGDKNC